jgi:hypothetical protein
MEYIQQPRQEVHWVTWEEDIVFIAGWWERWCGEHESIMTVVKAEVEK